MTCVGHFAFLANYYSAGGNLRLNLNVSCIGVGEIVSPMLFMIQCVNSHSMNVWFISTTFDKALCQSCPLFVHLFIVRTIPNYLVLVVRYVFTP